MAQVHFFPKPDFFWILHNISRPKVRALINPSESIVDIIVARRPVINNPYANGGRTACQVLDKRKVVRLQKVMLWHKAL
ncbi:MAG: hypothetical protein CM1200mP1_01380 [Candidatus Neomarinimicrobiota bacterium]|nr:MAG: hypothetical protein CM1200mP1_01380 [Candidatus Neomarinimicrobiota bacterium]